MATIRQHSFTLANPSPALPRIEKAPPVTLAALYTPNSWDAATGTWKDKTTNGLNLTQYASKPLPVMSEFAGVKGLRFDGTKLLGRLSVTIPQPFTAYVYARVSGWPTAGRDVVMHLGSPSMYMPSVSTTGFVNFRLNTTDIVTASGVNTAWHMHRVTVNGATSSAGMDGTNVTGTFGTDAGKLIILGATNATETPGFKGDIAAIAIAPKVLTTQEQTDLAAYLQASAAV